MTHIEDPALAAVADVVRGTIMALRSAVLDMEANHTGATSRVVDEAGTLGQALTRLDKLAAARPRSVRAEEVAGRYEGPYSDVEMSAIALMLDRMNRASQHGFCRRCGGVP